MDYLLRQYSLPLLFALLLHALAAAALQIGWEPGRDVVREIKPQIVNASLLVLEPKQRKVPQPPKSPPPRSVEPPKSQSAAPVRSEPKPTATVPPVDPQAEQRRREAQQRDQEAREKEQRLREMADSSFRNALDEEVGELADTTAELDEVAAQSFQLGIYQKVVANWSRPPSARNGMQAKLLVELVPTGDVVAVTLVEGSGSGVFDQSAESAVRKARRFEVPRDSALFEKRFRRFTLLFRPEDLLR